MGFLFNQGAKAVAQQNVAATGMPIQTSVYGKPISISYGMTRIAPNLIWYAGFTAIPHNNPSAGGGKGGTTGGGGKGGGGNVTYTYEVDIIEALCEGTISGVNNMWVSQTETTPAAQGISIFNGANGQATWSFLTSNFPSQALPYSGVAYAAAGPFNLDKNSSLPNINYEVKGIYYGTAPNGIDADASLVLNDLLTNTTYGVGIATNRVGTLVQNDEAQTIPSSPGPYTVTVTNASSFQWNLDVVDSSGIYTCVASNPGARQ